MQTYLSPYTPEEENNVKNFLWQPFFTNFLYQAWQPRLISKNNKTWTSLQKKERTLQFSPGMTSQPHVRKIWAKAGWKPRAQAWQCTGPLLSPPHFQTQVPLHRTDRTCREAFCFLPCGASPSTERKAALAIQRFWVGTAESRHFPIYGWPHTHIQTNTHAHTHTHTYSAASILEKVKPGRRRDNLG